MPRDYYEILDVDRSADDRTLKKAYRQLALKHHPDRNPDNPEAEAQFKEASEAYEVLSNGDKRKIYDQYGHDGLKARGMPGGFSDVGDIFSSFGDIFSDLFGFGRPQRRRGGPEAGADYRHDLEVSFLDAALGAKEELEFTQQIACKDCDGSGAKDGRSFSMCRHCNGRGQVSHNQGFIVMAVPCTGCRGSGRTIDEVCEQCDGHALIEEDRKVSVDIPAGVDNGVRIRLTGQGGPGNKGGPPGDLYVFVHVAGDPYFRRDGYDIVTEAHVDMVQAALGCTMDIKTLRGSKKVKVPAGTQPGDVLALRKEGIEHLRGRGQGDHLLLLNVEIPKSLNRKQRKLLEEFGDTIS